ncbi:MAG TPA: calcium-binding protein [Methyloceanibacter sp.]|jgi:Ca2+-binding RTX toxin-like protein
MPDILASVKTQAVLEGGYTNFGSYSGQLEKPGDHDWIKVSLEAGKTYEFFASFLNTDSFTTGDSTLRLRDAAGAELTPLIDDGGVGFNSYLSYSVTTSGTYFIDIGELNDNNSGNYGLFMSLPATRLLLTNDNDTDTSVAFGSYTIVGGKGADYTQAGSDACTLLGEQGNDILIGRDGGDYISGGLGHDTIAGGAGGDILFGDAGDDDMSGDDGNDELYGSSGNDIMDGGTGGDFLFGGSGRDVMTGGSDNDQFVFTSLSDSKKGANRDVIADFSQADGDFINLSGIDAKTGGGDNTFKFIGTHVFHQKAGELHCVQKGDFQIVEGDVNGDGKPDFQIEVHGGGQLHATDFVL